MKKILYLKAKKDKFSQIPILTVTNYRNGKRVILDLEKIQSRKYWTWIYTRFGYRVRPNHIRLDHKLICLVFDVPSNRIHQKLAKRLFNSWKNNTFKLSNIHYDKKRDILHVTCPDYNPTNRFYSSLGITKDQMWYLLRQSELKNKEVLGLA
ncbi:MAG: hypothetical protein ACP6IQ_11235 [Candidatus Njordarchaeia archaeon]